MHILKPAKYMPFLRACINYEDMLLAILLFHISLSLLLLINSYTHLGSGGPHL